MHDSHIYTIFLQRWTYERRLCLGATDSDFHRDVWNMLRALAIRNVFKEKHSKLEHFIPNIKYGGRRMIISACFLVTGPGIPIKAKTLNEPNELFKENKAKILF